MYSEGIEGVNLKKAKTRIRNITTTECFKPTNYLMALYYVTMEYNGDTIDVQMILILFYLRHELDF